MPSPVIIVEYDPQWPVLFEDERSRILDVLGPAIVRVEHVGSTSVPGLCAKPIIDVMVAVRRLADAAQCIEPLQGLGYEYVPEYETDLPERRYFRKGGWDRRTHHLHMVELESAFWERHLLFRDYLRAHPATADQYCRLKRELARRYGSDRNGYTEAKTPFVTSVEAVARAARAH